MATIDAQGRVRLTDRSKDVINPAASGFPPSTGGSRPLHPDVLQAAAIAVPHEKWQERPIMVVVLREGAQLEPKALIDHMAPHLARWQWPDAVEIVDSLPVTGTGKVQKLALQARYRDYQLP